MSTPTPLPATNNRFSILSEDDDDDVTVAMSNLSSDKDEPNDDATATTTIECCYLRMFDRLQRFNVFLTLNLAEPTHAYATP